MPPASPASSCALGGNPTAVLSPSPPPTTFPPPSAPLQPRSLPLQPLGLGFVPPHRGQPGALGGGPPSRPGPADELARLLAEAVLLRGPALGLLDQAPPFPIQLQDAIDGGIHDAL